MSFWFIYTDLFSSMDGSLKVYSWGIPLFVAMFMWILGSSNPTQIALVAFSKKIFKSKSPMAGTLFFLLLLLNVMGLSPMCYPLTSSLIVAFSLSMVLWMYLLLSGLFNSPRKAFGHLLPSGTPALLVPIMIMIETVSIAVRPVTLAIRLIANVSAGHIILGLVAAYLNQLSSVVPGSLALLFSIFYMFFELFVSIIQAYIFSLLISMYAEEHP